MTTWEQSVSGQRPVAKVRRLFEVVRGGTPPSEEGNWGGPHVWVTPEDLSKHHGGRISTSRRTLSDAGLRSCSARLAPSGSLVLSSRAPIGYVAETSVPVATNQGAFTLIPRINLDSRFYRYQLLAARAEVESLGQGATFVELSTEALSSLPVAAPTLGEQRRIADFLDRETARIDAIVQAKKRLLHLVAERWRNEVRRAVTQGLSSSEYVAVASPWFDQRPINWRLMPLKRNWTVLDCKHRTPEYVEEGYPLVSHGEIEEGRVYPGRSGHFVSERDFLDLVEGRRPRRGDVIYTRNAAIGNAGYVDTDRDFAMGQDVCLITSEEQDQRFLTYFLNHVAVEQLAAQRLGATFGRINVAQIVDLQILTPPPDEQCAIADYLDARREKRATLAAKLRRQIDLLDEHRKALVTTAITGQAATTSPSEASE